MPNHERTSREIDGFQKQERGGFVLCFRRLLEGRPTWTVPKGPTARDSKTQANTIEDDVTTYIESEDELRKLYGVPKGRSKDKQLSALEQHSKRFVELSPFVAISTYGKHGAVDCSPRGGRSGFVRIVDDGHILLPDAKGNNRLDSLVNILETGKIGCLFLVPGVDETLRVNGRARLSTAGEHLALFSAERHPPRACIEVTIEEVFLHCAKALMRSQLWSAESQIDRSSMPTMGRMLNDQLGVDTEPESQEAMLERYRQVL